MSPWAILGIEPTGDAKTIRRAYAAGLRAIDADREPAAFQRLRAAYEAALHGAAQGGGQRAAETGSSAAPRAAASPAPRRPAWEDALDPALAATVEGINTALKSGEVAVAAETLLAVRQMLPLAVVEDMTIALAVVTM